MTVSPVRTCPARTAWSSANGTDAAELRAKGKGYRYDLTNPLHLRLLADRLENERNN